MKKNKLLKAKGRRLDRLALLLGLERKTYYRLFKESDIKFKRRLKQKLEMSDYYI